ncbi:MAG TPA: hypothetical protein VI488_21175 [Candidatus Angelobacter sp.]
MIESVEIAGIHGKPGQVARHRNVIAEIGQIQPMTAITSDHGDVGDSSWAVD